MTMLPILSSYTESMQYVIMYNILYGLKVLLPFLYTFHVDLLDLEIMFCLTTSISQNVRDGT